MNDTSFDVATEMVKELEITDWEPDEIAKMIDGEISSLVPGWGLQEDDENNDGGHTPHHHSHHPFHSSSSHSSSSQVSLSNMTRDLQDWQQDDFPDDTHSPSSSHSGSYSNVNYISVDEHSSEVGSDEKCHPSPVITRTHHLTRFCPEETSHLQSGDLGYGRANMYAPSATSSRILGTENRTLTRNRSLVDVQSQLLHRSLVEEARKRRMIKTVGDVETVGFQSPYVVSRKTRNSRH